MGRHLVSVGSLSVGRINSLSLFFGGEKYTAWLLWWGEGWAGGDLEVLQVVGGEVPESLFEN